MDHYSRKRKTNYQPGKSGFNAKKPSHKLEVGLKGFLTTCNFREKECIRESYNLLNEYSDKLYGEDQEEADKTSAPAKAGNDLDGDDDIQTSLEKELASLNASHNTGRKPEMRKFQVLESGSKNILFVRTTLPDPVGLVHSIVKDIEETKTQKARFILRMLPVETTCKAFVEDIKVSVDPLLTKYFTAEGKSFSILFNCRNNKSVSKERVIDELAAMVAAKNPANRVDLTHPELSVLVEIIRSMCCISVLPEYYRFKKYNLLEIAGIKEGAVVDPAAQGDTVPDDDQDGTEEVEAASVEPAAAVDGGCEKVDAASVEPVTDNEGGQEKGDLKPV